MKNNRAIPALTNSSIIGGVLTSTIKDGNTDKINKPQYSEYTGLCTINGKKKRVVLNKNQDLHENFDINKYYLDNNFILYIVIILLLLLLFIVFKKKILV